jgi:hypothetical protein
MAVGQTAGEPADGGRILRSHVPPAALTRLLRETIYNDASRYPLSPPIQILRGILAKFRPE